MLVQRAETMLHDYHDAPSHLSVSPTGLNYKINFDAAIFPRQKALGFGVVIHNERG